MDQHRGAETTGVWRLVRGCAVGAAATGIALGGHLGGHLAGGSPSVLQVVPLLAVVLLVGAGSVGLSRFRWTLPRLLGALLVAQPVLHLAFATPGSHAMEAGGGMHHPAAAAPTTVDLLLSQAPMLVGHLVAAALTAALLRSGEGWLRGVLDALGLRAVRLLQSFITVYAAAPQPVALRAHVRPRQRYAADAWSQRGPPCG